MRGLAIVVAAMLVAPRGLADEPQRPASDAASPGSDSVGASGLLTDLERIVTTIEGIGWFLDEEGFRSVVPTLLESV